MSPRISVRLPEEQLEDVDAFSKTLVWKGEDGRLYSATRSEAVKYLLDYALRRVAKSDG